MVRILLLLLAAAASAQPALAQRVSIFVGPQTRDGYVDVDSGTIDSIKDIQAELRRTTQFTVTTTPGDAVIALIVVGRGVPGSAGTVGVTIPGAIIAGVQQFGTVVAASIDKHAITTILRVGTYEKQIVSIDETGSRWTIAARRVVKDVTAWTDANRAALAK